MKKIDRCGILPLCNFNHRTGAIRIHGQTGTNMKRRILRDEAWQAGSLRRS